MAYDPNNDANFNPVTLKDSAGSLVGYSDAAGYPASATILQSSSGNVVNAAAVATLAAAASKTNYLNDFDVSFTGATAASAALLTITGLLGGTRTYVVPVPAGATAAGPGFQRNFDPPLVASGANVAIVVSLAALGAGNTNAAVNAHGFQV